MFGIIYEPYELLDGRFQVIGEIIEGWDALIELEETIFKIYEQRRHCLHAAFMPNSYKQSLWLVCNTMVEEVSASGGRRSKGGK